MKKLFTGYKKFISYLIILLLILWIVFTKSPLQKGGVSPNYHYFILLFLFSITFLVSCLRSFKFWERFWVVACTAIISLVVGSLITDKIVKGMYHGKTWVLLYHTKSRIFVNFIDYGLFVIFSIACIWLYVFLKQKRIGQS